MASRVWPVVFPPQGPPVKTNFQTFLLRCSSAIMSSKSLKIFISEEWWLWGERNRENDLLRFREPCWFFNCRFIDTALNTFANWINSELITTTLLTTESTKWLKKSRKNPIKSCSLSAYFAIFQKHFKWAKKLERSQFIDTYSFFHTS